MVESVCRWCRLLAAGRAAYSHAACILTSADGGGGNGYRPWLWKWELSRWASEMGLTITMCHLPPGTSNSTRIEHWLFSYITMNI